MYKRILLFCLTVVCCAIAVQAQHVTVAGRITDDDSHKPIEFASILMKENGYWAITDADGMFSIKNMPMGKATLTIQCPAAHYAETGNAEARRGNGDGPA